VVLGVRPAAETADKGGAAAQVRPEAVEMDPMVVQGAPAEHQHRAQAGMVAMGGLVAGLLPEVKAGTAVVVEMAVQVVRVKAKAGTAAAAATEAVMVGTVVMAILTATPARMTESSASCVTLRTVSSRHGSFFL